MTHKYLKPAGLTALLVGCSMGIAVAETPAPPPGPPNPQQEKALKALSAKLATSATTPPMTGSSLSGARQIPTGWNFAHATHCGWFLDSSGGQWYYIFPAEGGIIFSINNQWIDYGLLTPCGEGYWIGWFVTDSVTGAYNQTYSYDFR